MKTQLLLGCILCTLLRSYAQNLDFGKYSIGYQTLTAQDWGSPYDANSPRTLPIHVWYPAQKSKKSVLKFEYFVKADKNDLWQNKNAQQVLSELVAQYTDTSKAEMIACQLLQIQTHSILNRKAIAGQFPLVIINSGLSSAGYVQSFLAEYLASYGYVVASYPSLPESKGKPFEFNQRGVYSQISDIELSLNRVKKLPFVRPNQIAMIAWSIGGVAQILYQMKYHAAQALVSLDAASQYEYGWGLIKNNAFFDNTPLETSFLQLTAAKAGRFVVARSSVFADSVSVNKKQITFLNTKHAEMLSLVYLINSIEKNQFSEFQQVCESTKHFLERVFKDNLPLKQ